MKSKFGRKKLETVWNERELLQKTALSTMKSFQIIYDQLVTISFSVTKILCDKPATILRPRETIHNPVSLSKNDTQSKFETSSLRHGLFYLSLKN